MDALSSVAVVCLPLPEGLSPAEGVCVSIEGADCCSSTVTAATASCSLSLLAGKGSTIRVDSVGAIVDGGASGTPAVSVVSVVGFSSITGVAFIETVCSSPVEVTLADAEEGLGAGGSNVAVEL